MLWLSFYRHSWSVLVLEEEELFAFYSWPAVWLVSGRWCWAWCLDAKRFIMATVFFQKRLFAAVFVDAFFCRLSAKKSTWKSRNGLLSLVNSAPRRPSPSSIFTPLSSIQRASAPLQSVLAQLEVESAVLSVHSSLDWIILSLGFPIRSLEFAGC